MQTEKSIVYAIFIQFRVDCGDCNTDMISPKVGFDQRLDISSVMIFERSFLACNCTHLYIIYKLITPLCFKCLCWTVINPRLCLQT